MDLSFLTREVFDTLIVAVILIGAALAVVRLYRDFTRPLTGRPLQPPADVTESQPNQPMKKGRR